MGVGGGRKVDRCLIYHHGARAGDAVALTFDDGPNPPRTEQVLAILADAGVRATFFVIGRWVERFPETVRRILAGGHLIGNHSYSARLAVGDYDEGEVVIGHAVGAPSRYFRAHAFDYGAYFQSHVSRQPGVWAVDADVNPADYAQADSGEIVRRVLAHPSLGPGSIIDLHDGGEMDDPVVRLARPLPTIAALPGIIAGLRARGLRCARLDELELVEPTEWAQPRTARR
jgi:peptidoglycan/xylan/chitin deacetylase (PgdA/CDA1 family)